MKRAWSSAGSPGSRGVTSSNLNLDRIATPLKVFWPCTATLYPSASIGWRGNASSTVLVSCKQTMSGARSLSQAVRFSIRCLIELTFQVAMRIGGLRPAWDGAGTLTKKADFSKRQKDLKQIDIPGVRPLNGRASRGADMLLVPVTSGAQGGGHREGL